MLHKILYLKSFDEPWWMLEGWEKDIVSRSEFADRQTALAHFEALAASLSKQYIHQKTRGSAIAFWNEGDTAFCEDCEEDLQVFYGLLWLEDGKLVD